jgi:hypothetical protein
MISQPNLQGYSDETLNVSAVISNKKRKQHSSVKFDHHRLVVYYIYCYFDIFFSYY